MITEEIRAKEYFSQGKEYSSNNDHRSAAELFERAAETYPQDIYYYNAGVSRQKMLACDTAVLHYKEVIKMNEDFTEAYYNMALCYERLGQLDSAQTYYNIYQRKIAPKNPE